MGLAMYAAGLVAFPNQWSLLVAQVAGGCILYVGVCRAFRLTAFMDVWQAMSSRIPLAAAGSAR
jgi:hypothetical protein